MIPSMGGALSGVRVIEIGALGAAPFAAMMLADHGADVLRVERPGAAPVVANKHDELAAWDLLSRGRLSAGVDLKHPDGAALIRRLTAGADVLIEGFRPGVAERLGIGPDELCLANERLIYGRLTGWGRIGPLADRAGHDINYISVAGVQAHIGRAAQPPSPPLNLVGDFGGGGMLMAFGIVCGMLSASTTGVGQVVDAAMVDGASILMMMIWAFRAMGIWEEERGVNILDTGSHFYDTYECADGRYVSIGSIEPQFYAELLRLTGLEGEDLPHQMDRSGWTSSKARLAEIFLTKTREEWSTIMEGTDVCFAPVLSMSEAARHPHNVERKTFVEHAGLVQPAPAPRFSETPGAIQRPAAHAGQHTDEVLGEWLGLDAERVAELRSSGAVA
jgi:alpha-methylacyl-CoA racemase